MNTTRKIPTIIGILILILGLGAGVALVQFRQIFKLGAAGGAAPRDVRIANISGSSASVSWLTEKAVAGFVKWGNSQGSLTKVEEDEIGKEGFTHMVTVRELTPQTTYYFKINSGGDDFDNNGVVWQVTTGPALPEPSKLVLISGTVLSPTSVPSKNSLVYVSVAGTVLSTSTSSSGSWVVPLSLTRTQDLSKYLTIDLTKTLVEISVEAGPDGVASAKIYPQSANPAPPIVLGQVYDFRNLPANTEGVVPNASIGLPTEGTPSSKFQVPKGTNPSIQTVTLDSTKNSEVVTTGKPEFFGSGPPGTKLTIAVQSQMISASIQIPSSGEWKWSPITPLSSGTHTITISWKDASGVLRTLTRTFVVQASEGPAFVSTPSATLRPSPTPTPIPTLRPTAPPTPATGSLTPTLLLFIMGVSTLAFGVLLWRKA